MTPLYLIALTPLICVPGLQNGYVLPKEVYFSVLAFCSLFYVENFRVHFPWLIGLYLLSVLVSGFNAINLHSFFSGLSLELSGLIVFCSAACMSHEASQKEIDRLYHVLTGVLIVGMTVSIFWFPIGAYEKIFSILSASLLPIAFCTSRNYRYRILIFCGLFIMVASYAVISASRVAMGLIVIQSVYFVWKWFSIKHYKPKFMVTASLFVGSMGILTVLFYFFSNGLFSSIGNRLELWRASLEIYGKGGFWGVGFRNWEIYYNAFIFSGEWIGPGPRYMQAHNDVIERFSEIGPLGAIAFVAIFLMLALKKTNDIQEICAKMTIVSTFLACLIWPVFHNPMYASVYWLLAGVLRGRQWKESNMA